MEGELEPTGGGQGRGIISLSNKNKIKHDEIKEGLAFLVADEKWETWVGPGEL